MSRFRTPERARPVLWGACLCALALACGDVKEWENKAGKLTLSAQPLPPVAGMPLTLAVTAENVGPIEVFQGNARIATFANLKLDGKSSFSVTAVSEETPRAVSVAYDYKQLEVEATAFTSPPGPSANGGSGGSGGSGGAPSVVVEDCPGVTETPGACSEPGTAPMNLQVVNNTPDPITVYRRQFSAPGVCFNQIQALMQPGASRTMQQSPGNVILVMNDATATALRVITLPDTPMCTIVL